MQARFETEQLFATCATTGQGQPNQDTLQQQSMRNTAHAAEKLCSSVILRKTETEARFDLPPEYAAGESSRRETKGVRPCHHNAPLPLSVWQCIL